MRRRKVKGYDNSVVKNGDGNGTTCFKNWPWCNHEFDKYYLM
jgi:hypothetical protein